MDIVVKGKKNVLEQTLKMKCKIRLLSSIWVEVMVILKKYKNKR